MPPFQGMDASNFKLAHPFRPYAGIAYAWAGGPKWSGRRGGEVGAGKEVVSAGSCWSVVDLLALDGDAVDRYAGLGVVQLPRVDCGLTGLVPGS